jgi:hypothetical protein
MTAILHGQSGARCLRCMATICRPVREFLRIVERGGGKNQMRLANFTELAPERSADGPHEPAEGEYFSSIPQVSGRASGPEARPAPTGDR